jgi:hypothetical protein
MVSDDFVTLPLNESVGAFEDVLQRAWLVNRKPGAHHHKQADEKQKYQQLHRDGIRDGRVRVFRFNVERPQQPVDWAGEKLIQNRSKPELFVHGAASSY